MTRASPDVGVGEKVARAASSLFLAMFGFILTKSGRDALYFQDSGIRSLPWACAMKRACLTTGSKRCAHSRSK